MRASLTTCRVKGLARGYGPGRAVCLAALVFASLAACRPGSGHSIQGGGSPCPAGNPLRGVYHPWRLQVLGTCVVYAGIVRGAKLEEDGDHHLYVVPDPADRRYLDARSRSYGDLVVEIMPGQQLPIPPAGANVTFVGTWVFDTEHDWNKIHPVWAERLDGHLYVGFPPKVPLYQGGGQRGAVLAHGQRERGRSFTRHPAIDRPSPSPTVRWWPPRVGVPPGADWPPARRRA